MYATAIVFLLGSTLMLGSCLWLLAQLVLIVGLAFRAVKEERVLRDELPGYIEYMTCHPTFPRAQGLNGAAVEAAASIVVQDVRQDPRYLTTFGATRTEASLLHPASARQVSGLE